MKTIYFTKRGRERWSKLMQANEQGLVERANKRYDIGRLAGIKDYNTAHSWATSLLRCGALKEETLSYNNGNPIHKYEVQDVQIGDLVQKAANTESKPKSVHVDYDKTDNVKITIQVDSTTIVIENANVEYLVAIIRELSK